MDTDKIVINNIIITILVILLFCIFFSTLLYYFYENDITNWKYKNRIINTSQSNLHKAEAMLLTCIDFRLIDDVVIQMNKLGYLNNYDQFILAGASLGYNGVDSHNYWIQSFDDHIKLSKDLHDTKEIIIIDHMNCGMYKSIYGEIDKIKEYNLHVENLNKAKLTLNNKYPDMIISLYIINIEGKILHKID